MYVGILSPQLMSRDLCHAAGSFAGGGTVGRSRGVEATFLQGAISTLKQRFTDLYYLT